MEGRETEKGVEKWKVNRGENTKWRGEGKVQGSASSPHPTGFTPRIRGCQGSWRGATIIRDGADDDHKVTKLDKNAR